LSTIYSSLFVTPYLITVTSQTLTYRDKVLKLKQGLGGTKKEDHCHLTNLLHILGQLSSCSRGAFPIIGLLEFFDNEFKGEMKSKFQKNNFELIKRIKLRVLNNLFNTLKCHKC